MIYKVISRFDAFALALGGVSVKSPYAALPVVASDRINAVWDARLRNQHEDRSPAVAPEGACAGWAT